MIEKSGTQYTRFVVKPEGISNVFLTQNKIVSLIKWKSCHCYYLYFMSLGSSHVPIYDRDDENDVDDSDDDGNGEEDQY